MFERSTNLFSMSQADDQDYSVIIKKAEMSLRQVLVRYEVMEVHNKSVVDPQIGPFNYPISRSKVIKHTLAQGAQDYTFTLLDTTQIPTQLILGLVKEAASAGSKGQNPFNWLSLRSIHNRNMSNTESSHCSVAHEISSDQLDGQDRCHLHADE